MKRRAVIKVGGNELDDPRFVDGLAQSLAREAGQLVLIHGGGKEISAALQIYDQPVQFIEGLRVTPPESMAIMEMVACGSVNKRLVARFNAAGVTALGLSGVDLGLIRCRPLSPELGRVGMITSVAHALLDDLLARCWLPIIAPVALGEEDFLSYNVNADHIAQAIAVALGSQAELVFVTNVPGVILAGEVVPFLSPPAVETAIEQGEISGGMIPKVRSALTALAAGVASVRITNLAGLAAGGTRFGLEAA